MMQLFTGLFSQNQDSKEDIQKMINQLKYYIALIEFRNKYTSCFFLDLNLKNNNNSDLFFLCTNSNFVSQNNIESKEVFNIHFGDNYLDVISIKLDIKQRKIKQFNKTNEFILIQIFPELDKIPKDKIFINYIIT